MFRTPIARYRAWAKLPVPRHSIASAETAREEITTDLWGFGIGAILIVALAADFLAAISVETRLLIVAGLAGGISLVHKGLSSKKRGQRLNYLAPPLIGLVLSMFFIPDVIEDAMRSIKANDQRCLAIQNDMLSAQPRRDDGADLFQALACQPDGDGNVFAKPTRLERAAGRALLEGGRR